MRVTILLDLLWPIQRDGLLGKGQRTAQLAAGSQGNPVGELDGNEEGDSGREKPTEGGKSTDMHSETKPGK